MVLVDFGNNVYEGEYKYNLLYSSIADIIHEDVLRKVII